MRKLCHIAVFLVCGLVGAFQAPIIHQPTVHQGKVSHLELAMSIASTMTMDGSASTIHSILKKPSKVLTVGLEYTGGSKLSPVEISILSMQLRKSKVSAIWSTDLQAIQQFASEQQSAKGNFPGPCPVIYFGPTCDAEQAVQMGASAVVVSVDDDILNNFSISGEIIWKVQWANDVKTVMTKTEGHANVFWVDGDADDEAMAATIDALPSKALWIASVTAMQPDGAEIEKGKGYKTRGCGSILVRNACIGDSEDTEYAQFCVGGFTSKASSEFKFSGLTGSTNGHFGGIQANSSVKWKRLNS